MGLPHMIDFASLPSSMLIFSAASVRFMLRSNLSTIKPSLVPRLPGSIPVQSDKNLLMTGWFSDCKVVCGNKEWLTHKNILCSRSTWFAAALDGGFAEAASGIVTFEEMDTGQIQWALDFLYASELPNLHHPREIIDLWIVGNFLNMIGLVEHAEKRMKYTIKNILATVSKGFLHRSLGQLIASGAKHASETVACPQGFTTQLFDALCDPQLANYRNIGKSSALSPEFDDILRGLPNDALVSLVSRLYGAGDSSL